MSSDKSAKAVFQWDDPLLLDQQLTEDERMIRDSARAYAQEKLLPRVPKGGIVAFDELNFAEFPGETQALVEKVGLQNIALKRLPFCSRISYFVR